MAIQFNHLKILALKTLVCAALVLCAAPSPAGQDVLARAMDQAREAGVPEQTVTSTLAQGYSRQLPSHDTALLLQGLAEAAAVGAPMDPMLAKIKEGLAKRVAADRIASVLSRMTDDYAYAKTLAGSRGGDDAASVFRLAQSLNAGLPRQELSAVLKAAPKANLRETAEAVEFMAALRQSGVSKEQARQAAVAGLEEGFFEAPDWSLARAVREAKRQNVDESDIASGLMQAMRGQAGVRDVANRWGVDQQALEKGPRPAPASRPGAPPQEIRPEGPRPRDIRPGSDSREEGMPGGGRPGGGRPGGDGPGGDGPGDGPGGDGPGGEGGRG